MAPFPRDKNQHQNLKALSRSFGLWVLTYVFGPCLISSFTEHQDWSSDFNSSSWLFSDLPLHLTKVKQDFVPTKFQVCLFLLELIPPNQRPVRSSWQQWAGHVHSAPDMSPCQGRGASHRPSMELETWWGRWLPLQNSSQALLNFAVTHLFYSSSL